MFHPAAPTTLNKLRNFQFDQVINEDPLTHSLTLLGTFPGTDVQNRVTAIVRVEKTALDPETAGRLFTADGLLKKVAFEESSDIYTWLFGWLGEDRERDVKINVVCPATEIHIRKV
ncbi:hypothetical protein C0993_000385 [Termitomyces sp. T159_Od127]|nr:hypothetical protein C0993_000385 [Termitomyces sp. T159_Od127]